MSDINEFTPLELRSKKWLKETDTRQFSEWELLSMFATQERDRLIDDLVYKIIDLPTNDLGALHIGDLFELLESYKSNKDE